METQAHREAPGPGDAGFSTHSQLHPSVGGLHSRAVGAASAGDGHHTPPNAGNEAPANAPPAEDKPGAGKTEGDADADGDRENTFMCNICLSLPSQPVTTVCGHVYCWGCLYKWLSMHRDDPACPVCKAGVEMPNDDPSKAKVIPLYVNGRSEADPRTLTPETPPRPPTDRPPPQRFPNFQGGMHGF
mmetsp:Transcript_15540/g.30676  ORF Transcript_15540/g.30676 Transcript_15540/m.30676 type:complete len:187 (+) Transcript_15540:244-804(+)